jgi:hypothetical protein
MPERPLSPCVISTVTQRPEGDSRGGVVDMDHERAAADRGAVDPFRGEAHTGVSPAVAMPSTSVGKAQRPRQSACSAADHDRYKFPCQAGLDGKF